MGVCNSSNDKKGDKNKVIEANQNKDGNKDKDNDKDKTKDKDKDKEKDKESKNEKKEETEKGEINKKYKLGVGKNIIILLSLPDNRFVHKPMINPVLFAFTHRPGRI